MESRKKIIGIIFNISFYVVVIAMIVSSTMFAFSNNESKSIFGYRFYTVLSDSMRPEFAKGDMIIVRLTRINEIKIGDVITFNPGRTKDAYLTHRVVGFADNRAGVPGSYVITRGDMNDTDDPPIHAELVIGKKVFSIPVVGSVIKFIQDNFIPMIIAIASSFILILILKSYFSKDKPVILEGADTLNDMSRIV